MFHVVHYLVISLENNIKSIFPEVLNNFNFLLLWLDSLTIFKILGSHFISMHIFKMLFVVFCNEYCCQKSGMSLICFLCSSLRHLGQIFFIFQFSFILDYCLCSRCYTFKIVALNTQFCFRIVFLDHFKYLLYFFCFGLSFKDSSNSCISSHQPDFFSLWKKIPLVSFLSFLFKVL